MTRHGIILICILGILASLGSAAVGRAGDSPRAAVGVSVSSDSGNHLYSYVGRSVGTHMRHMVAAGYTRRISGEARLGTRLGPAAEDLKPAITELRYANPLDGAADFDLSLKQAGPVRLEVYSVEGRKVATLLDRPMAAGNYSIQWDGRDARGQSVTAGVYFCRFETRDLTVTTKLVLSR